MTTQRPLRFDNSYARLPGRFFTRLDPEPVARPGPIRVNRPLAVELGIDPDWLASPEATEVWAGNRLPPGAEPIATVYAGHQFGGWNPQLGDGRAILLGETLGRDGQRYDIQLKGSGRTPYSRGGDGRAPLGAVLREYLVSESMAALGVPTTRSLAVVSSGEPVRREQSLPGGVLVRVAASHIRIGTFQFFASRRHGDDLRLLADHVIARHYPALAGAQRPYLALLEAVIGRQAALIAQWQSLGFIHGVMNTDNMLLSGETIDYGPCAFMDDFDPARVYSSIDHHGRYAFNQQPGIAHWNLVRLAETLLPLIDEDQTRAAELAQERIDSFPEHFEAAWLAAMRRKLGLSHEREDDADRIAALLSLMAENRSDFTLTFRRLTDLAAPALAAGRNIAALLELPATFGPWLAGWCRRLEEDPLSATDRQALMDAANPVFIPRNHRVEEAIVAAERDGDLAPFHRLADRLGEPFAFDPEQASYAMPPRPEEVVQQTFCGT